MNTKYYNNVIQILTAIQYFMPKVTRNKILTCNDKVRALGHVSVSNITKFKKARNNFKYIITRVKFAK